MIKLIKQKSFQSPIYDENAAAMNAAIKLLIQLSNIFLLLSCNKLGTQQKFDTIDKCINQQKDFNIMDKEIELISIELNSSQIDMLTIQQHLNKLVSILIKYDVQLLYVEGRLANDKIFVDLQTINDSINDWCKSYINQIQFIPKSHISDILESDTSSDAPLIFHICRLNIKDPDFIQKANKLFDEVVDEIDHSTMYLTENDVWQRVHDTLGKIGIPVKYWNTKQIWLDFHKMKMKSSKWSAFVKAHKLYRDGYGVLPNLHTTSKLNELNQIGENILLEAITERCNDSKLFDLSIDTNTFQCCIVLTMAF